MPYIPPEVVEQARQIDLLTYLQSCEPQELVRISGNNYTTRTHDSLKISNGKWMWWSQRIGGYNALDYLVKVKGCSFVEAVETLMGKAAVMPSTTVKPKQKTEPKILLLPDKSASTERITEYLFGRGIDYTIIQYCIDKGLIFESLPYRNLVCVGFDEKNTPRYEKSTKNVWWKCNTCGYEWKAVVKARVKGGMCPVCAERAVLQGYNDLGTTDPYLLSEWDFEKNTKWTPSNVSRNSMKVVWWKCGAGHSYRAKIADRTIEQKGCPQCEAEFQQALPQMLIMMYGAQNGITVKSNSDSELGMRLVAYLPELHCAVDIAGAIVTEKREQSVKAHICQSNRLGYYLIKRTTDTSQMAAEIKTLFIRNHIYLHTDSEKDVQVLRERFLEWKYRNACKLNGKY